MVPHRSLARELGDFSVPFVPREGRRRLVRLSQGHFLGLSLRRFARLKSGGRDYGYSSYADSLGKLAAEKREADEDGVRSIEIKLRADILIRYCELPRLVALWVTDSMRYSERALDEFGLHTGAKTFRGETFCYSQWSGIERKRSPMQMHSQICGKRVLFASDCDAPQQLPQSSPRRSLSPGPTAPRPSPPPTAPLTSRSIPMVFRHPL